MATSLGIIDDRLIEVPVRISLTEVDRLVQIVDRAKRFELEPGMGTPVFDGGAERLAAFASFLLGTRRRRETAFPSIEFGEPSWDMLLDLYVNHVEGRRVSMSQLCAAAMIPATTAMRWIDVMVLEGHLVCQSDPNDGTRDYVELSADLVITIETFLDGTRRRALEASR